jgi:hypothetical protein
VAQQTTSQMPLPLPLLMLLPPPSLLPGFHL